MAITVICVLGFMLPYRFSVLLELFSLFSWRVPVPGPPCLNDETREEEQAVGVSAGVPEGSW